MNLGAICPMKKAEITNGTTTYTYAAPMSRKGERLMFIYLGSTTEPDKFDAVAALKRLGFRETK